MVDMGELTYTVNINDKKYYEKLKRMEDGTQTSAEKITAIFKKLVAALAFWKIFSAGVAGARAFSKELANIKSVAGELDLKKLSKEITSVNSALGDSASLANAVYFAYSAGVRGTEAELVKFTATIAGLAKTIGAEVTPTMDAATTMINAYGLSVKDAGMLSDWFYMIVKAGKTTGPELANALGMIASTAATAKVPIDQLGAAIATLTTTMPTAQAITSLNQVLLTFIKPTDEAKQVASGLGIELSATSLASKGLARALAEINAKAGDNVTALTAMFSSVEAFKAAASLAGTQAKTFQDNVVAFAGKSGEAAKGLAAQLDSFDSRMRGLEVTMQKLGRVFVEFLYNIVTLGGALNPMLDGFSKWRSGSIELAAKITALTVGMGLLYKAAKKLETIQTAKAEAVKVKAQEEAERLKTLQKIKYDAMRSQSEQGRHLREVMNAQKEAVAVEAAEARKLKAAKLRYNEQFRNNRRAKYAYALQNGSTAGYKDTPEFVAASNDLKQHTESHGKARKAIVKTRTELKSARREFSNTTNTMKTATAAVDLHGVAVAKTTAKVGLFGRAWKGLKAAFATNPIGWALLGISMALSGIMFLAERAKAKLEALREKTQEAMEEAMTARRQGDEDRKKDTLKMERLQQLAAKQKLTNEELEEAKRLTEELKGRYGDIGVEINDSAKNIKSAADAMDRFVEAMKTVALKQLQEEISATQKALAAQKLIVFEKEESYHAQHANALIAAQFGDYKSSNDSLKEMERIEETRKKLENGENVDGIGEDAKEVIKLTAQLKELNSQMEKFKNGEFGDSGDGDLQEKVNLEAQKLKVAEEAVNAEKERQRMTLKTPIELDRSEVNKRLIDFQKHHNILKEKYQNDPTLSDEERKKKQESLQSVNSGLIQQSFRDWTAIDRKYQDQLDIRRAESQSWQDGVQTQAEKSELKRLELMQQQRRVKEAQEKYDNTPTGWTRADYRIKLMAESMMQEQQARLGQLYGELQAIDTQRDQVLSGRKNDASFSAQVLNILGQGTPTEEKIAKATEESARYLRDIRNYGGATYIG